MKYDVVIIGGGSAGISVGARLVRLAPHLKGKVAIFDKTEKHYYQPLWTLVGGGAAKKEDSVRDERTLIPNGVDWIKQNVITFSPEKNEITTDDNSSYQYDFLVVATGLEIYWEKIKGLKEAIGKKGVCSNYSFDYVESTWDSIKQFKGGTAIFTQPSTPIKCGGAPQKIMYLADDYFEKAGVKEKTNVMFMNGLTNLFAVRRYEETLEEVVIRKGINTAFEMELIEIKGDRQQAIFKNLQTNEVKSIHYDMIHVTPQMGPSKVIKESPLADEAGWINVDKYTLQHVVYPNVFGAGDNTNLPTSKTGAAIRKQAPVVATNIVALMNNKPMTAKYDGYTSCPLVTGYNKLVLAEFDYDKNPQESFPLDQSKERASMYAMKKHLLPVMYWNGMLKGLM
ncbi:MAG: FAD-dependent oxidoreductase [Bacillaceae bacterium]